MACEYTDPTTGQRYYQMGSRVYRITDRGNLIYDHDVTSPPAGASWWQRLLLALRRLAGA